MGFSKPELPKLQSRNELQRSQRIKSATNMYLSRFIILAVKGRRKKIKKIEKGRDRKSLGSPALNHIKEDSKTVSIDGLFYFSKICL